MTADELVNLSEVSAREGGAASRFRPPAVIASGRLPNDSLHFNAQVNG